MPHILRLMCIVLALWLPAGAHAQSHHATQKAHADLATVSVADLPPEAHNTLRAIKQNGPYAYPRDGVVFGNYEQILPGRRRGYYHEYTVKTPGARNRGARRIICGPLPECYYTADHYKTFKRILEQP